MPLTDSVAGGVAEPAEPCYSDPRYERLEHALRQLPRDMRDAVRMRRFEGMGSAEIAARTGRSDAAVRKLLSRAMARLTLAMQSVDG